MTVDREMPPQSCCTSSMVYFARLSSRFGLICSWLEVFVSMVHSAQSVFYLLVLILRRCLVVRTPSLLRTKSWHWFHRSSVHESATSDRPLRFLLLPFGECNYFFKDKPYLAPTIANAREFVSAGAAVIHSLFGAPNDFGYPLGAYPGFSFD